MMKGGERIVPRIIKHEPGTPGKLVKKKKRNLIRCFVLRTFLFFLPYRNSIRFLLDRPLFVIVRSGFWFACVSLVDTNTSIGGRGERKGQIEAAKEYYDSFASGTCRK